MAIIAILSTVAVVSYSAIVNKAEQSKVDSELAQIVNVLRAEAAETETVKDATSNEELTLTLSEKGELQFDAKLLVVDDETMLNTLFDNLLVGIELDEYTAKLNLDLADQDLVYTVGTVSSTLDVVINVVLF